MDELKETALSVLCLSANLDMIIKRIKENKGEIVEDSSDDTNHDLNECYDDSCSKCNGGNFLSIQKGK